MRTRSVILDFIEVTKKKLLLCTVLPLSAILVLLFGFVCDEVLGLGGTSIANAIYSAGNYLYCFILLPLTFIDLDITSALVFKIALILTPVWWYLLACTLVSLVDKAPRE